MKKIYGMLLLIILVVVSKEGFGQPYPLPSGYNATIQYYYPFLGVDQIWTKYGLSGDGIRFAIIDDGVDLNHNDLVSRLDRENSVDYTDDKRDYMFQGQEYVAQDVDSRGGALWLLDYDKIGTDDPDHHGTPVAGVIVGGNGIGVAYNGEILSLRNGTGMSGVGSGFVGMLGKDELNSVGTTGQNYANAIKHAVDNGVKILSLSQGLRLDGDLNNETKNAVDGAIEYAEQNGMLIVSAVNNYPDESTIGYPTTHPKVLAVGGMDRNFRPTGVSGPEVDCISFSVDILSTDVSGVKGKYSGDHGLFKGTSYATPMVAGVLGLVLEANPHLSPVELRELVKENSNNSGQFGVHNDYFGYGLIQPIRLVEKAISGEIVVQSLVPHYERNQLIASWTYEDAAASNPGFEYAISRDGGSFSSWEKLPSTTVSNLSGVYSTSISVEGSEDPSVIYEVKIRSTKVVLPGTNLHNTAQTNFKRNWPVRGGDCSAANSYNVLHGFQQRLSKIGDYLHSGIDIVGSENISDDCVRAPLSGKVYDWKDNQSQPEQNSFTVEIKIDGDTRYYQIAHLEPGFSSKFVKGQSIMAGEEIGFIGDCQWHTSEDHVRLQYYGGTNAHDFVGGIYNPFDLFDNPDYQDPLQRVPELKDIYLHSQKDGSIIDIDSKGYPVCYGKVDIVAEAYDIKNVDSESWSNPSKVGYSVSKKEVDGTWSEAISELILISNEHFFNSSGLDAAHNNTTAINNVFSDNEIYRSRKDGSRKIDGEYFYSYLVTNATNQIGDLASVDGSQCWATNAAGENDGGNGMGASYYSGFNNTNVQFPDGIYKVNIHLSDEIPAHDVVESKEVLVDNYIPFIRTVKVYKTAEGDVEAKESNLVYHRTWTEEQNLLKLENLVPQIGIKPNVDDDLLVVVEASEPMEKIWLGAEGYGVRELKEKSSEHGEYRTFYVKAKGGAKKVSKIQLVFDGEDYAGNALSSDPTAIITRNSNGEFNMSYNDDGGDQSHVLDCICPGGGNRSISNDDPCLIAYFTMTDREIMEGESVTITDLSMGTYSTRRWYINDILKQSTDEVLDAMHFQEEGEYTIRLEIEDADGNVSTDERILKVNALPTYDDAELQVNFYASKTKINTGETIDFTNQTIGGSGTLNYQWIITGGQGFDPTQEHPSGVQFTDPGFYTVQLQVTDDNGMVERTKVKYIEVVVGEDPFFAVDFTMEPSDEIIVGTKVNFTNTTVGGVAPFLYEWTINGASSIYDVDEENNTEILFDETGEYEIVYQIVDSEGKVDRKTKTLTVVKSGQDPLELDLDNDHFEYGFGETSFELDANEPLVITADAFGGDENYTFEWTGDIEDFTIETTNDRSELHIVTDKAGRYNIGVKLTDGTIFNGAVGENIDVSVDLDENDWTIEYNGQSNIYFFTIYKNGTSVPIEISNWSYGDGETGQGSHESNHTYSVIDREPKMVTVTATFSYGSGNQTIKISKEIPLYGFVERSYSLSFPNGRRFDNSSRVLAKIVDNSKGGTGSSYYMNPCGELSKPVVNPTNGEFYINAGMVDEFGCGTLYCTYEDSYGTPLFNDGEQPYVAIPVRLFVDPSLTFNIDVPQNGCYDGKSSYDITSYVMGGQPTSTGSVLEEITPSQYIKNGKLDLSNYTGSFPFTQTFTYKITEGAEDEVTGENLNSFVTQTVILKDGRLNVDAGEDKTVSPGGSVVLGGKPTASGGKAPYTYNWSSSFSLRNAGTATPSVDFDNSADPTTFGVLVTSANGCTATDNVTITPEALECDLGGDLTIYTGLSKDVNAEISGGTLPYRSYEWVAIENGQEDDMHGSLSCFDCQETSITPQAPDTDVEYRFTVTDANGFTSTCTTNVHSEYTYPEVTLPESIDMCIDAEQLIDAEVSGGIPPFSYDWEVVDQNGTTIWSLFESLNILQPTASFGIQKDQMTATLTVTDGNGFTSTKSVEISVHDLDLSLVIDGPNGAEEEIWRCEQGQQITLTARPSQSRDYVYSWRKEQNGSSHKVGSSSDYTVTDNRTAKYELTVIDQQTTCAFKSNVVVKSLQAYPKELNYEGIAGCSALQTELDEHVGEVFNRSEWRTYFTYNWTSSPSDPVLEANKTKFDAMHKPLEAAQYHLTIKHKKSGCEFPNVVTYDYPEDKLDNSLPSDFEIEIDQDRLCKGSWLWLSTSNPNKPNQWIVTYKDGYDNMGNEKVGFEYAKKGRNVYEIKDKYEKAGYENVNVTKGRLTVDNSFYSINNNVAKIVGGDDDAKFEWFIENEKPNQREIFGDNIDKFDISGLVYSGAYSYNDRIGREFTWNFMSNPFWNNSFPSVQQFGDSYFDGANIHLIVSASNGCGNVIKSKEVHIPAASTYLKNIAYSKKDLDGNRLPKAIQTYRIRDVERFDDDLVLKGRGSRGQVEEQGDVYYITELSVHKRRYTELNVAGRSYFDRLQITTTWEGTIATTTYTFVSEDDLSEDDVTYNGKYYFWAKNSLYLNHEFAAPLGVEADFAMSNELCPSEESDQRVARSDYDKDFISSLLKDPIEEKEDKLQTNASLYPNPTSGVFRVTVGGEEEARIVIFNTLGQMIEQYDEIVGSKMINLEGYHAGHYFVKVYQGDNIETLRVMIE